jgi:hypothetical protein
LQTNYRNATQFGWEITYFTKNKNLKSLKAGRRRELRKKTSEHFQSGRHFEFSPGTPKRPERHHFFTHARQGCRNHTANPYGNPRDQVGKQDGITASTADAQCVEYAVARHSQVRYYFEGVFKLNVYIRIMNIIIKNKE